MFVPAPGPFVSVGESRSGTSPAPPRDSSDEYDPDNDHEDQVGADGDHDRADSNPLSPQVRVGQLGGVVMPD